MAALKNLAPFQSIRVAIVLALQFSSFYYATAAMAAEEKVVENNTEEILDKKSECEALNSESESWYDITYAYVSTQFCEPAAWFDSFFSSDRVDEEAHPGARVRWRTDIVQKEYQGIDYVTTVKARFRLPKAKKTLNLIFESEQEESVEDIVPANRDDAKSELGLLYELRKSDRGNLSLKIKLSPSAVLRYRYKYHITETLLTRFTEELFHRDSANGHSTRIDFEKKLSKDFAVRQSTAGTRAENIDGTNWDMSLVLFQHLSDVSALSYESSATGATEPDNYVTNTRLGVRYRRNFFRKWLFYEMVPAVNWPRTLITDERRPVWEFMFRLEVNFVNL